MSVARRLLLLAGLLGLFAVATAVAFAATVSWGSPTEVPGTAALNLGNYAGVASISCPAASTCAAGGSYRDASDHGQAFVANETNGAWGKALEVPGTKTLKLIDAQVSTVSCGSPGNCAAGGYDTPHDWRHAFLVDEVRGAWHKAIAVPGVEALNRPGGGDSRVTSISCPSAGNCGAGGLYSTGGGLFVLNEKKGVWGKAIKVPAIAALNAGRDAALTSLSCASPGYCAAGGRYRDGSSHYQAFAVTEKNGVWSKAKEIPGTATLNHGGDAGVTSVSCATATACAASGYYRDASGHTQAFVVSSMKGVWGKAIEVPGTAALNLGGLARLLAISCRSAGNCSAGGYYSPDVAHRTAFVVGSTNGVWGTASAVTGAINNDPHFSQVTGISCASAGNCAAIGGYDAGGNDMLFLAAETNGVWADAVHLTGVFPYGIARKDYYTPRLDSISCAKAGNCAIGGYYEDSNGPQAYVTSP